MKPYWKSSDGEIYHGNVLDVLRELPDESVQMCCTSPPYWGLRDYGNEPQIWSHDRSVETGLHTFCNHVWGTDKYGINSKNDSSQGQFCQHCNAWKGSLGLEPTPELFIKHMVTIFAEVKRVLRSDGTLWLNIGDSYAGQTAVRTNSDNNANVLKMPIGGDKNRKRGYLIGDGLKPKDLVGIPWMLAFALRADGWWLRSDIIWHKPNPMPESVTDRPTKAHEYLFLLTKSARYYYDADAIREPLQTPPHSPGWASNVSERNDRQVDNEANHRNWGNESGRNKRTVWTIPTKPFPKAHFATFPTALIEPCILAGCPKGETVLDPFFGSGTTGIVAYKHGRKFIGIELSETYLDDIAIPRIEKETRQLRLFN